MPKPSVVTVEKALQFARQPLLGVRQQLNRPAEVSGMAACFRFDEQGIDRGTFAIHLPAETSGRSCVCLHADKPGRHRRHPQLVAASLRQGLIRLRRKQPIALRLGQFRLAQPLVKLKRQFLRRRHSHLDTAGSQRGFDRHLRVSPACVLQIGQTKDRRPGS